MITLQVKKLLKANLKKNRGSSTILVKPDIGKFKLPFNMFIIMFIYSLFRWENAIPFGMEASYNSVFVEGQYYLLFSSLFIHADLGHLFSNGWIFLVFAFLLYNYYGSLVFPTMSFVCGIATTAATIYFYPPNVVECIRYDLFHGCNVVSNFLKI